jgi:transposase
MDARKQTKEELFERRKGVIQLYIKGIPIMKIVEESGLSWHAVNKAITLHKEGETALLQPKARGKQTGSGRILSEEQEHIMREYLITRSPGNKLSMWNREAVSQVIEDKCAIALSIRGVGNYLMRWGFVLKHPNKQPYDRCSTDIRKWLDMNYTHIQDQAHSENAKIYWSGKTSIKAVITGKAIEKPSMISAVNNQGKIYWRVVAGKYGPDEQIKFLKALLKISKHKVILIREDTRIYGQSAVLAWLKTNEEKIKLFPNPTPDDPTLF